VKYIATQKKAKDVTDCNVKLLLRQPENNCYQTYSEESVGSECEQVTDR
jgi:hypothetical protein